MVYLSVALIVIGLILRVLAVKSLGSRFTLSVQRQEDIKTDGIYRYMRHPSYLGSLLILLGISLISEVAGIMTISWFFFRSRIANEEVLMWSEKYKEYMSSTGMFFPKRKVK